MNNSEKAYHELKLEDLPQRIEELKKEGLIEYASNFERDYEFAKIAFESITFRELLLIFYLNCCGFGRFTAYFRLAKQEAIVHQDFIGFQNEILKRLNKSSEV